MFILGSESDSDTTQQSSDLVETSESGVALILALWILTVLILVVTTFALTARYRLSTSDDTVRGAQSEEMALTGIETLIGQFRDDALLEGGGAAPSGIVPTEMMNENNTGKVKINEIKAADLNDYTCGVNPGFHVELVNVGSGPVDITGYFGRLENSVQMGPTRWDGGTNFTQFDKIGSTTSESVFLCPLFGDNDCPDRGSNYHRFFAVGTPDGVITGGGPVEIKICNDERTISGCDSASLSDTGVVDYARTPFSCKGSPPAQCGLTWQVYPDGSHGQKPSADRDLTNAPTNWVKAPCTMDATTLGASSNRGDTVVRSHNDYYGANPGSAVTEFNGRGVWIKRGDNQFEGMRFTQHKGNGSDVVFDFGSDISFSDLKTDGMLNGKSEIFAADTPAAPYCKKIRDKGTLAGDRECGVGTPCQVSCNYKERFYIDTMNGTGAAVFTRAVTQEGLERAYDGGGQAQANYVDRNGFRHAVPVIPMGMIFAELNQSGNSFLMDQAFPVFKDAEDRKIKVEVPKPVDNPLGTPPSPWEEYKASDRNLDVGESLNDANVVTPLSLATGSYESGWTIRQNPSEDPSSGLRRADSSVARPDPGGYRMPDPDWYSGFTEDYAFDNDVADSRLYVSEVFDTHFVPTTNVKEECNLKITFGRKDGGLVLSSPNFLEIFNPGPDTYVLTQLDEGPGSSFTAETRYSGNEVMEPGEYFVVAADTGPDFPNPVSGRYTDHENGDLFESKAAGFKVYGKQPGAASDTVCDRVAIDGNNDVDAHWEEGEALDNSSGLVFGRKKSREYGVLVPRDEGHNKNDFHTSDPDGNGWNEVNDLKWARADRPYASPQHKQGNYHFFHPELGFSDRSFVEVIQFEGPELQQNIGGDYIEIYNMGDTVDPTGGTLRISDSHDSSGKTITGPSGPYPLTLHRLDPYADGGAGGGAGGGGAPGGGDGTLKPGQVALILEPSPFIDVKGIGWRDEGIKPFLEGKDINKDGRGDTIRIYTTDQPDSEFLTGGLHDDVMETIEFTGTVNHTVVDGGSWDSDCAVANRSCFKLDIEGSNDAPNWNYLSRLEGTPGSIHRVDHFDKIWGWGGSITLDGSTVNFNQPICVPSMTNCPDPTADKQIGDVGYFEVVRIEDVGGKINLLNPPVNKPALATESLQIGDGNETVDDPAIEGRSFLGAYGYPSVYDPVGDAIALPDTSFRIMSPDAMLRLDGVVSKDFTYGSNALDEYEHVYTTMRPDTTSRRINVNTAPYEALKAIQVNPQGTDPTFMTQTMVEEIIDRRQCGSYTSGDHIPDEDYSCGPSPGPFPTIERLCSYLDSNASVTNSFDCEVIHDNAKVWSDGLIRAVVEGGVFGGDQIEGRSRTEVMIDRRGINRPGRELRVIFQRKL